MKKLSKILKVSLIAVTILSIASVDLSAQNQRGQMPTFENFDLNSDGQLTESEMNKAREKRMQSMRDQGRMLKNAKSHYEFSRIDANEDGVVTKQEFEDHQTRRRR